MQVYCKPNRTGRGPLIGQQINTLFICWLWAILLFSSLTPEAREMQLQAGATPLQEMIQQAQSGDRILLAAGTYYGPVTIDKPLSLIGSQNSIIDGRNKAHVITVSASDVVIKNLQIQNSGNTPATEDSGIFITTEAENVIIRNNYLQDNLIGIYLKGAKSAQVKDNIIIGSQFHRINDRGNGIYLWNSPGSIVENNRIRYGRDGIFVTTSRDNTFKGNTMRDLRFAIHYMYTQDSEVSNNISINNHVGYALMFSDRINAYANQSIGDSERGLFFNYANYSVIHHNQVSGGAEKCVFIYNANYNRINNNAFEGCEIGVHFTAGSEKNDIYENAFINNRTQVKYVGTRDIEWSRQGRGNYWSDNTAFDINKDTIADHAYQPNDLVDQIVWRHPMAKLLLNSPAVQVLKWAQSEFPGLHPGGVTDSYPLMSPPRLQIQPYKDLMNE
jgi:nitrous oxidase accessory protein